MNQKASVLLQSCLNSQVPVTILLPENLAHNLFTQLLRRNCKVFSNTGSFT
uniref:Uncharacterized protein n=1 Tax=Arundo donax TaxID=35708 RepID=A0A0A8XV39_ARUDO